ncbi:MAG: bifunctional precorrin-2 dehydrogenase/sirohydrochlorin ferrochelatase [Blautia sp.]|nr:bifunctional precorrin-2 dehydrogenase/sirohydrochlorin ferrochelatase [Blautia sp.]
MSDKRFFPLFIDLSDKNIVVVGGGTIATRRVKSLLAFTRNITVIAPVISNELQVFSMAGHIRLTPRQVKRSDLTNAFMVLAATNDWKLNDAIYNICKEEGIFVNVVNDRDECDFYFPGICIQDSMVVGVTASGEDHKRAKLLRIAIQKMMEQLPSTMEED